MTDQRTKINFAHCMCLLVDVLFPNADKIIIVLENLNTHSPASLYEAFEPAETKCILDRLEFHSTPKHASWLNMVEIEIGDWQFSMENARTKLKLIYPSLSILD